MRIAIFEPDVQQMVEALAQSWEESDADGVKLFHIDTDGWINKSLTCDGLHPTTEGKKFRISSRVASKYIIQVMRELVQK